ncbi:hypothetical protein OAP94_00985 [bacterium]|nr:hypothetical protein [bacterium]MDC1007239.1 hypothetical protein [bacterium]
MDTCWCPMERKKFDCYERRINCNLRGRFTLLKILIAGDSFAAEWPGNNGWAKLLAGKEQKIKEHDVTNIAQAGVGEYKILDQLRGQTLDDYDAIIVSHTSLSRVHTRNHPLHNEGLHKDCDLIWSDIEKRNTFLNPSLKAAKGYFEHHYDDRYYQTIYSLLRKEINQLLQGKVYISMSHIEVARMFIYEDHHLDFSEWWSKNKGTENHYSKVGNQTVHKIIVDTLNKLC